MSSRCMRLFSRKGAKNRKGFKKRMGATYVGVRRAHPYSWLLSSPQQPLETEDPPTVSLAPQYTPQRLCRATVFFEKVELSKNPVEIARSSRAKGPSSLDSLRPRCRFFAGRRVEISGSGPDGALDGGGDPFRVALDFKLALAFDHDAGQPLRTGVAEQQPSFVREPFLDVFYLGLNGS